MTDTSTASGDSTDPPVPSPSPRRVHLAASGPDQAEGLLVGLFGAHLQVTAPRETNWLLSMDGVDAGHFSSTGVVLPAHLRYAVGGHGDEENTVISTITTGQVGFERHHPARGRDTLDRYRAGDTYIGNQPNASAAAQTHDVRARIITLSHSLLAEAAAQYGDLGADGGRRPHRQAPVPTFTTMAPAGAVAARQWRRTIRYVEDTLADPAVARSALLVAALGRFLASTALTVFPNTLTARTTIEDRRDAHSDTLRRAVAFIEANPHVDITITDIARAAFVSPRTVQLTFRRHLGTTPLAYLRTVRLEQAHRQLQDASPGDGTTVAVVAARWGLTPSRFTERYRALYGVPPSYTLRSWTSSPDPQVGGTR